MTGIPARRTTTTRKAAATPAAPKPAARRKSSGKLTASLAAINDQVSHDALTPAKKPIAATRRDKKGLVVYVDKALPAQLRRLSGLTGLSVQELALTALNLLFEKHEMPTFPIEARP